MAPAMPALAIAAEATTTLRVGTMVIDNELIHPASVANDANWLNALTDGRFELGIGAGWLAADHHVLGRELAPPRDRVDRLVESVELIRAVWAGQPASFRGAHFAIQNFDSGPRLASTPPPLLIGGGGPRVMALAGRWADIASVVATMTSGRIGSASARTSSLEGLRAKVELVARSAASRFDEIELHTVLTGVFDWSDPRVDRAAKAYGIEPSALAAIPNVLVGDTSAAVDQLLQLRERTGISFLTIPEEAMERFAPVLETLTS